MAESHRTSSAEETTDTGEGSYLKKLLKKQNVIQVTANTGQVASCLFHCISRTSRWPGQHSLLGTGGGTCIQPLCSHCLVLLMPRVLELSGEQVPFQDTDASDLGGGSAHSKRTSKNQRQTSKKALLGNVCNERKRKLPP